ncbi:MAG TPA: hypothetical protein VK619_09885 [Pyrinomonadaceae bacterium]|nr:hypothetical protein [Pyrinomonadaceae bacterium]
MTAKVRLALASAANRFAARPDKAGDFVISLLSAASLISQRPPNSLLDSGLISGV